MSIYDVIKSLAAEGMPVSWAKTMVRDALNLGAAESEPFGILLINTNSGMPAEFRIERI